MDPEQVQLFVNITGASEQIAVEKLQAFSGNLNAAINSFYNEGEPVQVPPPQRENTNRTHGIEEDEPPIGQPVASSPSYPLLNNLAYRGLGRANDDAPELSFRDTSPVLAHPRNSRAVPTNLTENVEPRARSGATILESENAHLPSRSPTGFVSDEDEVSGPAPVVSSGQVDGLPFHRIIPGADYGFGNAPLPAVGHSEGAEIEEEMIQAAIAASKQETMRMPGLTFGEGHSGDDEGERRLEDDDMAWALSQSLKTAEEEKEMRKRLLLPGSPEQSSFQEVVHDSNSRPSVGTEFGLSERKVFPSAKDTSAPIESGRSSKSLTSGPSIVGSPPGQIDSRDLIEEGDELEEQPLLRRRSNRRLNPTLTPHRQEETSASFVNQEDQHMDAYPSSTIHANGHVGENDEWGGLSSEEQHDAVMLEAAMFGSLPDEVASRFHYPLTGRVVEDADMSDDGGGSNYPRVPQQPPSPSVIAQRLLREQQDDEYLASLEADREKEARAKLEEEMRQRKEAEAKAVAQEEHRLRQEEELRKSLAAKELERQLVLKRATLPEEPSVNDEAAVTLMVRMPDGSRQGRRFRKSDRLQCLFDFIDVSGAVEPGSYQLVRQYPRKALTEGELDRSFEDLALSSKHELLFLELV